jgi:ABC-type antimicrobial peptide transport system permease subunit
VLTLILRDGLRLAVPGVLLGAIGALALNRLLVNLLFGVSPTDPSTLAAVMAAVLAVALLACLVPALRATRVDAATVLREE